MDNTTSPIKVAIVGAGVRGMYAYAPFSKMRPDLMQVVACVEPNAERLAKMVAEYSIPEELQFSSFDEFISAPFCADVAIIATQDKQHYSQAILAMRKGYHILLEKPISPDPKECLEIAEVSRQTNRHCVVCHVLRFSDFYRMMKSFLDSGKIGDIMNIQYIEELGWYPYTQSYVRGDWRNSKVTSPLAIAKGCHDMDILSWLIGNKKPIAISSFGSLKYYTKENAPEGHTLRCLDGCKAKDDCIYDAEKMYMLTEPGAIESGTWPLKKLTSVMTKESVYDAIKTGPYGRCVYECDNDLVDNQIINIQFENGITVSVTITAFTEDGTRLTRIFGSRGILEGDLALGQITLTPFAGKPECYSVNDLSQPTEEKGDNLSNNMLVDFFEMMQSQAEPGSGLTAIDVSLQGHLMAFASEYSRINGGQLVNIVDYINDLKNN
jgi:predicted dehydrogenase